MFSHLTSVLPALLVATTVGASIVPRGHGDCKTGPTQCCQNSVKSDSAEANVLFELLGIVINGLEGNVGINCSPLNVLPIGGGSQCSAQTVCCENNAHGGLINIGCVPIVL
ncbi:fungal hydrophobin [Daedaleopsis nitida]|nr:fungal hydrophobin [Daedaleopsis nitida]